MSTVNYAERQIDVIIADGQTASAAIQCRAHSPVSISTDADFDGASLTLEHSFDGTTDWQTVQASDGANYTFTIGASQFGVLNLPNVYGAFQHIRFVSSAAQSGSSSTLKVLLAR